MEILIMITLITSPALIAYLKTKRVNEKQMELGMLLVGLYFIVSLFASSNSFMESITEVEIYPIIIDGVVTERDHYINEEMEVVVNLGDEQKAIIVDEIVYGDESKLVMIDYFVDENSFPENVIITLQKASRKILKLKAIE